MRSRFISLRTICVQLFFWASLVLIAQNVNVATYYKQTEGKGTGELKTTLHEITKKHQQREYYEVSKFFERYDLTDEGYIWDMYAEPKYRQWSGSGMNREHNMPKSWFGVASGKENAYPIGCDYHNLYPSNAEVNRAKSNYPLGETKGETFNNGTSKVGKNTYPGYSGIVFEPADEYKGDFARCYMYMVTCYEDYSDRWQSTGTKSMLQNNTYPTFNDYAVNLLMEWHREDPVSQKEIDRNDNLYSVQGNRNPFVDCPAFAEFIWGDMQGELWSWDTTYKDFGVWVTDGVLKVNVSFREGEDIHYEIRSMNGLLMRTGKLSVDSVPIDDLSNGMYILTVYSVNKRYTTRFIK